MALTLDPFSILIARIEEANIIGRKLQAANSDRDAAIAAVLASSDDPKIVKFREGKATLEEQIATLQAKITNGEAAIREHAETLIPSVEENFDPEAARKEFLAKRKRAFQTRQAMLDLGVSEEDLNAALKEKGIGEIVSPRGVKGGGGKGAGTGIRRPRISAATFDGETVEGKDGKVDFTTLAKKDKDATAQSLKAAAFAAAETEDLNSLPAGHVVKFSHNGHNYTVTVSGEKPGRKAAEKEEEKVS